ncbi:unnamed protein product [Dracunculus medinensis]|uniref:non-specific serine/threonine protein kinase n=1 Tax=Dracunculus medinensis TaxID=318479 RepID=A0A158Q5G0_DRAME|nr:unnamed protein product [Dracunculus medinensis]
MQLLLDDLLSIQNSKGTKSTYLHSTLYVTDGDYGLYAISAFVNRHTITIGTTNAGPPLLSGPSPIAYKVHFISNRENYPICNLRNIKFDILSILSKNWIIGKLLNYYKIECKFSCKFVQTSSYFYKFWNRHQNTEKGYERIGNILYNPQTILGRGCDGTIVYRGKFDGRQVAVKRVVAEMVHLVNREVDLLRESDAHLNVIRYFCLESDSHFRYIALELCSFSLYDYVENEDVHSNCSLTTTEIFQQAAEGIAYLHSINIVHRDIKPQNVLFSMKNQHGQVRVLISDFGLCKRLQYGYSVTQSGLIGTDGWIAPELYNMHDKITCAVDIFSLGCIFYYVLTKGMHPFGGSLQRQAKIVSLFLNLENIPGLSLIHSMLQKNPNSRPTAKDLLVHPFFWSASRQLQFFSDVSDRIEKEDINSLVVKRLEKGSRLVVTGNWRDVICPALSDDLKKFRSYKGHSVRDLLRAMRNKKHHYRELPEEVRISLGDIPEQFVHYFTSRFPELLMHTYEAMECCSSEKLFIGYYAENSFSTNYHELIAR